MPGEEFTPITLEGLEEGAFMADANAELLRVCDGVRLFMKQQSRPGLPYDGEVAGELKITIKLKRAKGTDAFNVTSAIDAKLPGRPKRSSSALHYHDAIVVRHSGSSEDSPRQQILATHDGRAVAEGIAQGTHQGAPRQKEL